MKKKQKERTRSQLPVAILALGVVGVIGLFIYSIVNSPSEPTMAKTDKADCTHSPVKAGIAGLETALCKSANHVPDGKQVQYDSDPPLAGEHWATWAAPGFYQAAQAPEKLVHNLEHGHVVIYYDQAKLTADQVTALRTLTAKYTGQWDGVVAVPRTDGQSALILTAWEHALRLTQWDQTRLDAFVDAFRGRGPENPVRPS